METSAIVSMAVESGVLAVYLVFSVTASILYFGRKSAKCCLLPFTAKMMQSSQASRKLAAEIKQRYWLDVLVSSIFFVILLRTFSELCQVVRYARRLSTDSTPILDQLSLAVLLAAVTSYNVVFCSLIWMWLNLVLSLFEDNKRAKSCILWTVRLTTAFSILSAVLVTVGMTVTMSIPNLYITHMALGIALFVGFAVLYFLSLGAMCTVALVLGIRIIIVIRRSTTQVEAVKVNQRLSSSRRTALIKVTIAVASVMASLVIRVAGIGGFVLYNYIPTWISTLALLSIPEFLTFGTLIVILWPFTVKCCSRLDTEVVDLESSDSSSTMITKKASSLEAQWPMTASPLPISSVHTSSSPSFTVSATSEPVDQSVESLEVTPCESHGEMTPIRGAAKTVVQIVSRVF